MVGGTRQQENGGAEDGGGGDNVSGGEDGNDEEDGEDNKEDGGDDVRDGDEDNSLRTIFPGARPPIFPSACEEVFFLHHLERHNEGET